MHLSLIPSQWAEEQNGRIWWGSCLQTKIKINGKEKTTPEMEKNQFGHLAGVTSPGRKHGLIVKVNREVSS